MRNLSLLVLAASLSGCWSGNSFYAVSESVPAIEAGKYRVVAIGGPSTPANDATLGTYVKISYAADGHATVDDINGGDSSNSTLIKLGDTPGLYVVQADLGAPIPDIGSSLYALINVIPDGYQIAVPKCDQKRVVGWSRAIVSGLFVGKPVCKFDNRADLETALLDYAKDPISWTEYRRIQKRKKPTG
jgi:hypothetical protein